MVRPPEGQTVDSSNGREKGRAFEIHCNVTEICWMPEQGRKGEENLRLRCSFKP